jgi:CheY-like chemotaxis protein
MVKQNQNLISDHSFYYDLIFLDLNMPICDGYEACTKIKQFYEDL